MKIKVLVCRPDGSTEIETRDVPEEWFAPVEGEEETDKAE